MRGQGFQPILGFAADGVRLYLYSNERGIRRFDVARIAGL